jgi:hypothetical protein
MHDINAVTAPYLRKLQHTVLRREFFRFTSQNIILRPHTLTHGCNWLKFQNSPNVKKKIVKDYVWEIWEFSANRIRAFILCGLSIICFAVWNGNSCDWTKFCRFRRKVATGAIDNTPGVINSHLIIKWKWGYRQCIITWEIDNKKSKIAL